MVTDTDMAISPSSTSSRRAIVVFPVPEGEVAHLGALVLAWETVAQEADLAAKALADHVTHLVVHGTLHLLGFDHADDAEADEMEAKEKRILAGLGLADPYTT